MRFVSFLLLLSLSACGYTVPGKGDVWVGGDAQLVYVELFDNRTAQPYLENYLTEALVMELSRSRLFALTESRERADVMLAGSVNDFSSKGLAYGLGDQISDYRATMLITAQLVRNEGGEVLWQSRMQRNENFFAAADKNLQLDAETLAARQISRRLAEDIHAALLSGF